MSKSRNLPIALSNVDESRWIRIKRLGYSNEDVAKEDGVALDTVRKSLIRYEVTKSKRSMEHANEEQAATVIALAEIERRALNSALTAKRICRDDNGNIVRDGKNNPIMVDDHDTQLEAVGKITDKVEAIAPKSKGFSIVNQTQVGINAAGGQGQLPRFEDRIREIQQKREALLTGSTDIIDVEPEPA